MTLLARINRIFRWLEEGLLIFLVVGLLLLACTQIVLRNFFGEGILWAENVLRIAVLWIAMVGGMAACREGSHIKINILETQLEGSAKKVIIAIANLAATLTCIALTYASILFVNYERIDGFKAFLNLPAWWFELILPIGFTIMALRFGGDAISGILRQKEEQ